MLVRRERVPDDAAVTGSGRDVQQPEVAGQLRRVDAQEVVLHEQQGEVAEGAARDRLRARVGGGADPRRVGAGQRVTAVVADEDALRAACVRERTVPVLETLLEREQVVGLALAEQHRDVESATGVGVPLRPVLREERGQIGLTGRRSVRPVTGRGAVGEALVHRRGVRVRAGGVEGGDPQRAYDAFRRQALGEVPPGDLGGERVEPGRSALHQVGERADELVAAAVGPADRADDRIVGDGRARGVGVVRHPVEPGDEIDELRDVLTLERGVLDVCLAAALAEPALVEAEHAEAGVEPALERRRRRSAAATPAMAVEDERHLLRGRGAGRLEQRVADVDRRRGVRLGDALDAAVRRRDGVGREGRDGDGGRDESGTGEQDSGGSHGRRTSSPGRKLLPLCYTFATRCCRELAGRPTRPRVSPPVGPRRSTRSSLRRP